MVDLTLDGLSVLISSRNLRASSECSSMLIIVRCSAALAVMLKAR